MLLDLTNKFIKPIMIIALVSIVSTWAFGIYNVLITEQTINGITIKTVDLRIYLDNIVNAWSTTALNFESIIPSREYIPLPSNWVSGQYWEAFGNDLVLLFDWLYFPINFIAYILRWLCWILKLALALIGWNIGQDNNGNYYSELAKILSWITQNLVIPYI